MSDSISHGMPNKKNTRVTSALAISVLLAGLDEQAKDEATKWWSAIQTAKAQAREAMAFEEKLQKAEETVANLRRRNVTLFVVTD